jgi:KaiC/GvpD/RAD55 family RecA-like ATPase
MKKLILFFALIGGISFFASAQTPPRVAKKQVQQNVRINEGVVNGDLTRYEAKQLKRQQKHIQKEKQLAKADGVVTKREKAHIRHDQRIANRSIYRQKHDLQNR